MKTIYTPVAKLVSGVIHLEGYTEPKPVFPNIPVEDSEGWRAYNITQKKRLASDVSIPFKDQEAIKTECLKRTPVGEYLSYITSKSGIPLDSLIDRIEIRDFDTCSSPECDCPNGYCFSDKGDEGYRFKKFAIIKPAEPKTVHLSGNPISPENPFPGNKATQKMGFWGKQDEESQEALFAQLVTSIIGMSQEADMTNEEICKELQPQFEISRKKTI